MCVKKFGTEYFLKILRISEKASNQTDH